MGVKEIKARIAAEQAAQSKQAAADKAAADALRAQEIEIAEKNAKTAKEKKDAANLAKYEDRLNTIIAQLAKGGMTSREESTLTAEALTLDADIANIKRRLNITPDKQEPERMAGSLRESQLPFGGTSVGKVTGPITGGMDITPTISTATTGITDKTKKTKKTTGITTPAAAQVEEPAKEKKLTREEILSKYPIIDALFEQDPELQALLNKYVDPKSKMTLKQFKDELSQAKFNFKYADVIKTRMANKAIYDRLGVDAKGDTQYERDVAGIAANLESNAIALGATLTQEELNRVATNIYLAGTEARPLVIERALTPYIKVGVDPITGRPTVGGQAGANYQTLLASAAANGISETLLPKVLGVTSSADVLRKLAEGGSIRDYEQRFRDYAMNGRSDYVKNLLAQGVNFDTIVSPYRNVMADTLEIANPEQIKIDDPTLMMAFGDKEMTLYDFQRALRKDSRWQYTDKARQEVSTAALQVLRDFGFQG